MPSFHGNSNQDEGSKSSTREMQMALSNGMTKTDLHIWELAASFWVFFRRYSLTKPCECLYGEQKQGLGLLRYLALALSVWLQGLCLKMNFVLLCSLPLSYADLLNELFPSLESNVPWTCLLFIHIIYTGMNEWLGENWGATALPDGWFLAPYSAALSGKRLWVKGLEAKEAPT